MSASVLYTSASGRYTLIDLGADSVQMRFVWQAAGRTIAMFATESAALGWQESFDAADARIAQLAKAAK